MEESPSKEVDGDEAQKRHAEKTLEVKAQGDDEGVNEMTIEDWLAKHHEMTTLSLSPPINDDNKNESAVICHDTRTFQSICVRTGRSSHTGDDVARMPSQYSSLLVNNNLGTEQCDNSAFEAPVVEATINHAEPILMTNGDISVSVLLTATVPKDQLLIEGVNVAHTKRQRIYLIMGCLVLAILAAFAVAMLATRWLVHSDNLKPNSIPAIPENNATTTSPTGSQDNQRNMNWTIADAIIYNSKNGNGLSLTQIDSGLWFLQAVLNQTDVNITYFQASQSAVLFGRVEPSLIFKFTLPLWNGHIVSGVTFS